MRRRAWLALLGIPALPWLWRVDTPRKSSDPADVAALLSALPPANEFERAGSPREFVFPDDHAAHPSFRHEWWYFTGNLRSPTREFGFQLTFFRFALAANPPTTVNEWSSHFALLGHFALSDLTGERFFAAERLQRPVLGLGGAETTTPFRVWIRDWAAQLGSPPQGWNLRAAEGNARNAIELTLDAVKPPAMHGDRGLSRKGLGQGNASYYYSCSRLKTRGALTCAGESHEVSGSAWLDREWGTSALTTDQAGWDWFGLQLDDGTELMLYRLRKRDGGVDAHSAATFVGVDGTTTSLLVHDFLLTPRGDWRSAKTGVTYPLIWDVVVPRLGLALRITPRLQTQEWNARVRYWEGAVACVGQRDNINLQGVGYAEFTGYTA